MKHIFTSFVCMLTMFFFTACGNDGNQEVSRLDKLQREMDSLKQAGQIPTPPQNDKASTLARENDSLKQYIAAQTQKGNVEPSPPKTAKIPSIEPTNPTPVAAVPTSGPSVEQIKQMLVARKEIVKLNGQKWIFMNMKEFESVVVLSQKNYPDYVEQKVAFKLIDIQDSERADIELLLRSKNTNGKWGVYQCYATKYKKY